MIACKYTIQSEAWGIARDKLIWERGTFLGFSGDNLVVASPDGNLIKLGIEQVKLNAEDINVCLHRVVEREKIFGHADSRGFIKAHDPS